MQWQEKLEQLIKYENGINYEVHAYRNKLTGQIVEPKNKINFRDR